MRFLAYTLGDESTPPPPPSAEMMKEMDAFVEEATKAGVLLATGGVAPLAEKIKVSYHDGQFRVLDGPFTEAKELVGGWPDGGPRPGRGHRVEPALPDHRRRG